MRVRHRTVRLLQPLAADLNAWKLASGQQGEDALVFPTPGGELWDEIDWRNWRRRRFGVAAETAGAKVGRPYDLRHGFASLLLAEQRNPVEVAGQLGHSLQMLLSTYAHVIEEFRDIERVDPEATIRAARAEIHGASVAPMLPRARAGLKRVRLYLVKNPDYQAPRVKPTRGFEPRTPSLRVKCSTS
jgi:hypothetical protein